MQHKLLINGELVSGEGEKQPVYNPATGDVCLEIAGHPQSRSMLLFARQMQHLPNGGEPPPKARAECLLKLADVIEENGQVFAELESVIVANRCIVRSMMKFRRLSMFFAFSPVDALPEWSGGR
ncbi:hypothetical protein ACLK1Z_08540 [Escherichia coli]